MTYINPRNVAVPLADAVDNDFIQDVIGNKSDSSYSNAVIDASIIGLLKGIMNNFNAPTKIYPTGLGVNEDKGADPIPVTSDDIMPWQHGAVTEVIPVDTVDEFFSIRGIIVTGVTADDEYELRLYQGTPPASVEIGRIAFKGLVIVPNNILPINTELIIPNTEIGASLACADGDGAAAAIKIL